MNPKHYFRRVWHKLRYNHPLRLFFDALSKIGIRFAPYYVVVEGLFGETIPELENDLNEFELCFFGCDDMQALASIRGRELPEEKLVERLERGQLCYGVKYEGQPVAFNWVDLEEFAHDSHRFPMKDNEAYLFDAYTDMNFRGKGIAPYVRYKSYKELTRMGRLTLYSVSNYFNTSSIKFKKKLNAKFIELYLKIVLFKKWHFRILVKKSNH
jgi:hypothetical protein